MSRVQKDLRFTLLAAVSLDGKITAGAKGGSEWTSREDKRWFKKELDTYDAVIVGRKTFEVIRRPLQLRNYIIFTRRHLFQYSQEFENRLDRHAGFCGSPKKLLRALKKHNWKRIAVVGGTLIYDWFLKHRLVDELYLTVEPLIFGAGKPLLSKKLDVREEFKLVSVKGLNAQGTLILHYKKLKATQLSK